VEGVTGQLFFKRKPVRSSEASYDEEAARRLWEMSERLVEESEREEGRGKKTVDNGQ
jgi:hypothetical protein